MLCKKLAAHLKQIDVTQAMHKRTFPILWVFSRRICFFLVAFSPTQNIIKGQFTKLIPQTSITTVLSHVSLNYMAVCKISNTEITFDPIWKYTVKLFHMDIFIFYTLLFKSIKHQISSGKYYHLLRHKLSPTSIEMGHGLN